MIFGGKCRFWTTCRWYTEESIVCNDQRGQFSHERMASCWYRNRDKI